jgi:twinkle protein
MGLLISTLEGGTAIPNLRVIFMIYNIDEIKQAIDIIDIIGSEIQLKKDGANMVAKCPFHSEKTASFKVSKSKNIYKCFGCHAQGDAINFIMDYKRLNYYEAIRLIANKYNIEIDEDKKEHIKPLPRLEKLSPNTISYFENRLISNNTLLRFGITESIEWMPIAKSEIPVICFNYYKDEELINIKFRGKNKDFKLNKDSEKIFYNINSIKDSDEAVICEGEIDCLSLHEAGIYNSVSVPNGAATGEMQLRYLDICWQYFEDKKKVILFTDNDSIGIKLKEELSRRIGVEKCYFVQHPEDCKDANEVLIKYGKEYLRQLVENAKPFPIQGIISVEDVYEDVVSFYKNGYPTGYDTGIDGFDELLKFSGGQMTIVTGSPNSGKSEFLDYITASLSKKHGWKWGICSFENPTSIHVTKIMEKFSGLAFDFRKDSINRMNQMEFDAAISMANDYYKFVNISQVDVSIDGILNKLRELVLRNGINGVVIDPWNYIEHKIPANQTETQYVSECLSKVKEFATRTNTHVFIVAHPKKLNKDNNGIYPVATMYDISGSAHFFNKTDNGLSIHRDFSNGTVTVYTQKIRFSWLGTIGFTAFSFNTLTRQYYKA